MTDEESTAANLRRLLTVCWGSFDIKGNWRPNQHLELSAAQQRQENIDAGYMDEDGKRIDRRQNSR
jgi:hypothetical protein